MCNARVQNNVQGNVQSNVHGKYASQMRKANAQLGQVSLFTETNVPAQEQINQPFVFVSYAVRAVCGCGFVGVLVRTPSSLGYRDIVRVRLRRSARRHPSAARLS